MVETLISDKNPLLKEVRRLASGGAPGAGSIDARLVLAEGPRLLDEAVRSGIAIHAVILAESAPEIAAAGSTRVVRVLDSLFNKLASTDSPQGVLALVLLLESKLQSLHVRTHAVEPIAVRARMDGLHPVSSAATRIRAASGD